MKYRDRLGAEKKVEMGAVPIVIGRVPECSVVLEDERVSRRHCEIRLWDGAYAIKDLRSHNGTLLNEKPVSIAMLQSGDKIGVGRTIIEVEGTITPMAGGSEEEGAPVYRSILRDIVKDIE